MHCHWLVPSLRNSLLKKTIDTMRSTKLINKWWGLYRASVSDSKIMIKNHVFSIIANRVGAESYENFSDDNMLNFKYEGTIGRQSGDLLRVVFFYVPACFSNHRLICWIKNFETVQVQMKRWDLKAEDLSHPGLQIYHINKDTTPDESHRQAKHQVMLLIQASFQTKLLSHWLPLAPIRIWKLWKSSIKRMSQQAWLSFQHHLHQASKNHCFNNLMKRNKFNGETIPDLEWFNFSTI